MPEFRKQANVAHSVRRSTALFALAISVFAASPVRAMQVGVDPLRPRSVPVNPDGTNATPPSDRDNINQELPGLIPSWMNNIADRVNSWVHPSPTPIPGDDAGPDPDTPDSSLWDRFKRWGSDFASRFRNCDSRLASCSGLDPIPSFDQSTNFWRHNRPPRVGDPGTRVGSGNGYPTSFSGVATDANGNAAPYSGTRTGSIVRGRYVGESPGTFVGTLNRNRTVSGSFVEIDSADPQFGVSRGVFTGKVTPSLDHVFGKSTCKSNC